MASAKPAYQVISTVIDPYGNDLLGGGNFKDQLAHYGEIGLEIVKCEISEPCLHPEPDMARHRRFFAMSYASCENHRSPDKVRS